MRSSMAVVLTGIVTAGGWAQEPVYPEGSRFPLALYSIHTTEEMEEVEPAGWNVAHRYNFSGGFFETVKAAGWTCVAHLEGMTKAPLPATQPGEDNGQDTSAANAEEAGETGQRPQQGQRLRTESEVAADIARYAAHEVLAWWDFPEEQRWWRKNEYSIVQNLSAWTRKYDPRQRPNYMYLPGHYRADAVARYVPYLDIIGAGTYTEYAHQQRAWVRWRTEETIRGIAEAGFRIGADYKNGEKTPIGIPMLFSSGLTKMDVITPVEAYHDFWSCIASGAKGIFVFSYWHKRDLPLFEQTWELGYKRAARHLTQDPGLAQALLFGEDVPLTVRIVKGPDRTPTFRPHGMEEDLSLPAVNVLAKAHEGTVYIVAVSSQERPVRARIEGLPDSIGHVECMVEKDDAEDRARRLKVADGALEDEFPWLTVHLYRAEMP